MTDTMISAEEPDWLNFPGLLLIMIGDRLTNLKDFVRFRAVCKPWRRALAPSSRIRQSIPWLMLPYCRDNISDNSSAAFGCKGTDCCRCFYDPKEQQFHHIELPQGLNKTCRGSAFGWVFMVDGSSSSLLLLNPLTKDQISPITAFPDVLRFRPEEVRREYVYVDRNGLRRANGKKHFEANFIAKVALSAEPTSEECVVMVIRSPKDISLAFCRPNDDQQWTLIPRDGGDVDLPERMAFVDVAFWRGQFYVLAQDGRVYVCDLSLPHCPKLSLFLDVHPRQSYDIHAANSYLFTSQAHDELMMVARDVTYPDSEYEDEWTDDDDVDDHDDDDDDHHDDDLPVNVSDNAGDSEVDHYGPDSDSELDDGDDDKLASGLSQVLTSKVRVFKVKEDKQGWDEVQSIGDDFALFLGFNKAMWVSTRDHPEFASNSIYFTDDMVESHWRRKFAGADMGVYNLTTRTIDPFYSTASIHKNPSLIFPLPIWIQLLPSSIV